MEQKSKILAAVTIATAGTPQPLTSNNIAAFSIAVQADPTNTNNVYVGDSTINSSNGHVLEPGAAIAISGEKNGIDEVFLNDVFVDTDTNGNKVRIQYLTSRGQ